MELSVSSLQLKGRWYALGVLRDITARKHTERLLQEAEARWRLLLNSTGEGIYGVDTNDRCTFVNAACLKILGYQSIDSLLGKNIHPLIHHSRLDGTPYPSEQCQIYQSCRHGKNIHIDDEVFWRNRWHLFSGRVSGTPPANRTWHLRLCRHLHGHHRKKAGGGNASA
jgi:PAS domain S-box-containing protein